MHTETCIDDDEQIIINDIDVFTVRQEYIGGAADEYCEPRETQRGIIYFFLSSIYLGLSWINI